MRGLCVGKVEEPAVAAQLRGRTCKAASRAWSWVPGEGGADDDHQSRGGEAMGREVKGVE